MSRAKIHANLVVPSLRQRFFFYSKIWRQPAHFSNMMAVGVHISAIFQPCWAIDGSNWSIWFAARAGLRPGEDGVYGVSSSWVGGPTTYGFANSRGIVGEIQGVGGVFFVLAVILNHQPWWLSHTAAIATCESLLHRWAWDNYTDNTPRKEDSGCNGSLTYSACSSVTSTESANISSFADIIMIIESEVDGEEGGVT